MSMKTPLKIVRGLGSAKSGTEHFWQQRLTALANLPLLVFFAWFIITHIGTSRADVIASLKNPLVAIAFVQRSFAEVDIDVPARLGFTPVRLRLCRCEEQ